MPKLQAVTHYLIERELGRGAMGVVYLGHDTKLGRAVAVKTLPSDVSQDPRRRERFEQEARTLAAINHPNIASIYGLEHQEGQTYIVLEYVEGPTLTEKVSREPMSVEETLSVCRQVASGLDAAHQRGIVHRDLKPDNIKLRPDGVVKVLDFGIAMAGDVRRVVHTDAPTVMLSPGTKPTTSGMIVGTPGYMSPEQTRGRVVTHHTDLWALGCVIFECLTGRAAFAGESLADALAATLHAEPDWAALPARTPARVLDLVRRCLKKDVSDRPETMAWACEALEKAIHDLRGASGGGRVVVANAPTGEDWPASDGNLPAEPAPIGREREVAEAVRLAGLSRLVTLVGPGGSGRARVARAAAAAARSGVTHGAWLAPVPPEPGNDVPALSVGFAIGARGAAGAGLDAVLSRLGARRAIIVLTTCENAPTACAGLVHELLGACPNVRVIATARTALGLAGEGVVTIPGLACPDPEDVARGASDRLDAARVFLERLRAADPGLGALTPEITRTAALLCQRVGGWPGVLHLLAGVAASVPLSDLGERLEQRARLLGVSGLRELPPDGVQGLLARWLLDMLAPGELAVLLAASSFAGPFSARGLAAVGGARESFPDPAADDPDGAPPTVRETRAASVATKLALRGLFDLWTLDAGGGPGETAYLIPEAVRRAASGWLKENPAAQLAVATGHRAYHLACAEHAAQRWRGPGGVLWMRRAERMYPELVRAARTAPPGDASGERLSLLIASFREARGL
ncbi:MAG: protein kinase [Planctomycetota bacterium]|nr:protein kinase [Planctomycetota bacterium]